MYKTAALYNYLVLTVLLLAVMVVSGCNSTRHLGEGEYLLRKNIVKFKTSTSISNRGEIKDNLSHIIIQKTNTYRVLNRFPLKLWRYNGWYKKLHTKPDSLLPKTAERPVILDTTQFSKTMLNMRSYLFNQGYFYAKITDTIIYKRKKAYVIYNVNAGGNYVINKIMNDVDDSGIARLVQDEADGSFLKKNKTFSYGLLDEERNRLVSIIRNNGYYKFSLDNIRFEIDTMDKAFLKDIENPLENAINFISSFKSNRKPTIDIKIFIRTREDTTGIPYKIGKVTVYPDYEGLADIYDTTQQHVVIDSILFKYHKDFVHAKVMAERIYLMPGNLFAQEDQDRTVAKMNDLGVFQYIRIQIQENSADSILNVNIFLNRTKKLDVTTNFELSNGGSIYSLGNSVGASFRNKNFAKGANLLNISLNGGIELGDSSGKQRLNHISLLTQYYGLNTSLDFPKFIAPLPDRLFDNSNLPHTIISAGANVVDRVLYFTLTNTGASYKYSWKQSQSHTWEFTPAFINIIKLRNITSRFQQKLDSSLFLRNSYKEIFIEGENLTYTFSNIDRKKGKNYYRLKTSFEEAGALLGGLNGISDKVVDFNKTTYAQYTKVDFDLQRYFNLPHSLFALRLYGGVGTPYGHASALPYVKQYYVGGPYSLRGWRIRSLGPGSYYDSTTVGRLNTIDRTGDIKLEFNGEYRFPIVPLFSGLVKMNGALFTDAGNIWLARKDEHTKGGEFAFDKLAQDIAMDVGAGSRFEIASFLTLRVDVAMPLKKPYILQNNGWVVNAIDFNSKSWRSDNLIVNLSIGYPF